MMAEDFVDSVNKGYSNIWVSQLHFCSVLGSEAICIQCQIALANSVDFLRNQGCVWPATGTS